ncbi:hypothetical protein pb186bvf_005940, partial [Paramecium bursaria]
STTTRMRPIICIRILMCVQCRLIRQDKEIKIFDQQQKLQREDVELSAKMISALFLLRNVEKAKQL